MHTKCCAVLHQHFARAPASGAAEIVCKEQQDIYLGHDGGCMIPIHSKIGQEMRIHFEKSLNEYGMKDLIPVYLENDALNFLPEPRSEVGRNLQV